MVSRHFRITIAAFLSLAVVFFGSMTNFSAAKVITIVNPNQNNWDIWDNWDNKGNWDKKVKNGLTGEYFNNINLTGSKMTRVDSRVNFDWSSDSPDWRIYKDNFSIRWTGQIQPRYSESYTFSAITDAGARLWINDQLIINEWNDQAATEYKGSIHLEANRKYNIRLEYFEKKGDACAKLLWASPSQKKEIVPPDRLFSLPAQPSPAPGNGNGLKAEYYDNINFTKFKLTRIDPTVNFSWGRGSPDSGMDSDKFSVRWTGQVEARYSETYTFYTIADDGVRLWVNNKLVIDDWTMHGPAEHSGNLTLAAGTKYNIRLEYFESTETATIKLYWSSSSQQREIIPKDRLYASTSNDNPPPPNTGSDPVRMDMSAYFNEDAFSYDSARTDGNFDKLGNTYSADLVNTQPNFDNTPYKYGPLGNGYVNSARCLGQTITLPRGKYESLRYAGSATNGNKQVMIRVNYTDGTSVNYSMEVKDWCTSNTSGERIIQTMAHRHVNNGDNTINTNIYAYYIGTDKNKEINSITLPDQSDVHIFAITLLPVVQAVTGTGNGLLGEYYDNANFTNLRQSRTDHTVNFDWGLGAPLGSMESDSFSVRWTGQIEPRYTETYTIHTVADDGVRLWINNTLVIDSWSDQTATEHSGSIALTAGNRYSFRLDYYENLNNASVKLYWSSPRQGREIIPMNQLYH